MAQQSLIAVDHPTAQTRRLSRRLQAAAACLDRLAEDVLSGSWVEKETDLR